jgi:hypothetical protein
VGTVLGVVQANAPATLADPPLKPEALNASPSVIAEALGATEIVEVILFTVTLTVVVNVL